ncbi:MAG: bacillithiol biosynthesis cysteine-adding enzyme BshC [Bacteroidia bacterium]
MKAHKLPLSETGIYGKMMMDYLEGHPLLREFYKYIPAIESFPDAIRDRMEFPFHREELAGELTDQHRAWFGKYPQLEQQINTLRSNNTFTVTTGHQPCLAGGPMFFFYKLITTINLAHRLNEKYSDYHFVPVFWLGAEDHDLDEVNHVFLHGKTIRWSSHQTGATGRMSTAGLDTFLSELKSLFANDQFADNAIALLERAYLGETNLADATRAFALQFFAQEGLLVLDADRPSLKKFLRNVIHQELAIQPSFQLLVATNEKLSRNYKLQVNPREINLFYLDDQLRERIVRDERGHYDIVNTDLDFSKEFILDLADRQPERFSPNVILRPVYQEIILPNIAYIGGPGEIAYWLQLKSTFEHYQVFYPMLVPRNNGVILPSRMLGKFIQMGFDNKDVFRAFDVLSREWLSSQEDLSSKMEETRQSLQQVFDALAASFESIDPTLAPSVKAEAQKAVNSLENLMRKGNAALKRKHEVALNQIRNILEKASPNDTPQERLVNIFQFYPRHGDALVQALLTLMEPFSSEMIIIEE